jgi:hypothetical protein
LTVGLLLERMVFTQAAQVRKPAKMSPRFGL